MANKAIITVTIDKCEIVSVEKGSILSNTTNPVIAFTVKPENSNKPVKAIVKNELAKTLWYYFLNEGMSQSKKTSSEFLGNIDKVVTISFTGSFKEERAKEVVVEDIKNISLDFHYRVL